MLSCTGATASRNYLPGLTEAFYRHLPVVAITSTERLAKVGQNIAQMIDRSQMQKDVVKMSVTANAVDNPTDEWQCIVQVNKVLLEIHHHGTGPVHINLEKVNGDAFDVKEIPACRVIRRYLVGDTLPSLPQGRIGVFVGAHAIWTAEATQALDRFCATNDAVVFCDQTSNYKGKYRVLASLMASQAWNDSDIFRLDLLIIVGEISGDYYAQGKLFRLSKEVWRVNEDGLLKDTSGKLTNIFEMRETDFFTRYGEDGTSEEKFLQVCREEYRSVYEQIPELPFCNIWMARQMAPRVPEHAYLHFGILNSLRAWNFFEIPLSVYSSCNVGGFGIDGGVSSLIGSSLAHPDQLHFGIFGDLAFFYDMNVLGNRHVGSNVRIMLVNNAKGAEFKLYSHPASQLGDEGDVFIAAAGHYGNQSPQLVRHYAEDLGFAYLTASSKEEFRDVAGQFLSAEPQDRPMLLEVFTSTDDEAKALQTVSSLVKSAENQRKDKIKKLIGEENAHAIQRLVNKIRK